MATPNVINFLIDFLLFGCFRSRKKNVHQTIHH